MNITWIENTGKFSTATNATIGKWTVGSVYYDSGQTKQKKEKWVSLCSLPGIKNRLGIYETKQEAIERTERAIDYWFNNLFP